LEEFILNLTPFNQRGYTTTWADKFNISWNDWNKVHYLLSLNPFDYQYTIEEKEFIKLNIGLYSQARVYLQDMQDDGLLVSGIPIKLHTMSEKSQVVHNLEYCLDTYNQWISYNKPNYAIGYQPTDLVQLIQHENTQWKFGNIDTASLLTYNDIDTTVIKHSDLKL